MWGPNLIMGRLSLFFILIGTFVGGLAGCRTTADVATVGNSCRRFLVIPPFSEHPRMSDYVANRWIGSTKGQLSGCDKVVPFNDGKKALSLINVDHTMLFDSKSIKEKKLPVAAEKTSATDVVLLGFNLEGRRLTVNPTVYSLKSAKKNKDPYFKPFELKMSSSELDQVKSVGVFSILGNLLPNSISLGFHSNALTNENVREGRLQELSVRENSILPRVVSGLAFANISHPAGFGMFDLESRWFGSLGFHLLDNVYRYQPLDDGGLPVGDSLEYKLKFFSAAPFLNGGVSFYWPLGTTFTSLGFGPGFSSVRDTYGDDDVHFFVASFFQFGHRIFLSERFFLQLAFDMYSTTSERRFVDNEIFSSANTSAAFLGIGYFSPEVRSFVREKL